MQTEFPYTLNLQNAKRLLNSLGLLLIYSGTDGVQL